MDIVVKFTRILIRHDNELRINSMENYKTLYPTMWKKIWTSNQFSEAIDNEFFLDAILVLTVMPAKMWQILISSIC